MQRRYGSPAGLVSTTTTEDSPDFNGERRIRRLRLTLHPVGGENGTKQPNSGRSSDTEEKAKVVNGAWKKKNGLIQRERPAGSESPEQHSDGSVASGAAVTNGEPSAEGSPCHGDGPKVYGVVQTTTGTDRQQEVMAREWSVSHLQDEMRYIREVRDSLEKVRERMYGQFGGMQQSMQQLSQEIRTANSQRSSLEAEVRVRTAAMDSFDQMNSSLISANIGLQKSLLENCQSRVDTRDEVKRLRSSCEKTEERLREKERELAAAREENHTLKLQVDCSSEARGQVVQEVTVTLTRQYEEQLLEEQRKHRVEIEHLQAQIDEYVRRLEEAERNIKIADAKIAERDQRISEVERLLDCMTQEKNHFQNKLQEAEQRLRLMELSDRSDPTAATRSKQLEGEASDLRERIKHLNDMVFCQQRKVKAMIEEVQSLRAQVAQKDMFISELLDRIAIVECENNEFEDKLNYFMSVQNKRDVVHTREIGVGCDLQPRPEAPRHGDTPDAAQPSFQSESPPSPPSSQYHHHHHQAAPPPPMVPTPAAYRQSSPPQARPPRSRGPPPAPPSRLESSLLRYSPLQYSRYLQASNPSVPRASSSSTTTTTTNTASSSSAAEDSDTASSGPEGASSSAPAPPPPASYSPRARSSPSKIYTPFMRLMEITANINISDTLADDSL